MENCQSEKSFAGSQHVFKCMREEGHFGSHQSISKGYYKDPAILSNARWNEEGAVSGAIDKMFWNECDECNILIEDDKVVCFSCDNWLERIAENNKNRIIIDQCHYLVGSKGGFSGRKFSIEFLDPQKDDLVTEQLWSQGNIPRHFQNRLPDNARWITTGKLPSSSFADFSQLLNP